MADEVLAIAVSYERVVEDGQRVSFGTAFAVDMPTAKKNAILDELADLAARQAARARKPKALAELRKHRETLAQFQEDHDRLEASWPEQRQALVDAIAAAEDPARKEEKLAGLKKEIATAITTLQERRAAEYNAGLAEFRGSGRVGDYKPKGHRAVNLERLDKQLEQAKDAAAKALEQAEYDWLVGIEAAKEALTKAENEREVALANTRISVERWTKTITALEEELEELDALLET